MLIGKACFDSDSASLCLRLLRNEDDTSLFELDCVRERLLLFLDAYQLIEPEPAHGSSWHEAEHIDVIEVDHLSDGGTGGQGLSRIGMTMPSCPAMGARNVYKFNCSSIALISARAISSLALAALYLDSASLRAS